ncbi:MAG: hypothetical protein LBK44_05695 [Spirochaetales bacterium]|nr:hypothetical protein [Spirochaetales bacterium]
MNHLSIILWRIFCSYAAKNRAFRSKSSDLPMQILWAFRSNPLRVHQRLSKT